MSMFRYVFAALAGSLVLGSVASAQSSDTLTLSLAEAVRLARSGDEVSVARSRRDISSAQIRSARAAGLPQLRFGGSYAHVYENARAQAVGSIFNQPNTFNANLNLSLPVFQGGRTTHGVRSATRLREASEAELTDVETDMSLQALGAYLAALLAERLVEIQEGNLELADARLRQVEQLERAGRASRYDVLRARVERTNLEPPAIQARAERELALLELRRLTDIPETQPIRLETPVAPEYVRALAEGIRGEGADSAGLLSLPAVRAAQLRADAEWAGVRLASAGYLPTVSLNLGSGFQAFPQSARIPLELGSIAAVDCPPGSPTNRSCVQQNGGWFSDRAMQLVVSWPVFDGMRVRSEVQLARAQARAAEAEATQILERVKIEAARAQSELTRARALFEASRQNVAEADEAFRIASLRFSRGLGTQLEVSDAQLALLTARTNEARATHELYLAAAQVARARGAPIPLPGAPTPSNDPSQGARANP